MCFLRRGVAFAQLRKIKIAIFLVYDFEIIDALKVNVTIGDDAYLLCVASQYLSAPGYVYKSFQGGRVRRTLGENHLGVGDAVMGHQSSLKIWGVFLYRKFLLKMQGVWFTKGKIPRNPCLPLPKISQQFVSSTPTARQMSSLDICLSQFSLFLIFPRSIPFMIRSTTCTLMSFDQ